MVDKKRPVKPSMKAPHETKRSTKLVSRPKAASDARPMFVGGLGWPNFPRNSSNMQAMALQVELGMTQWWSPEKIMKYQLAQAQALINHAHKTVPYYKDILAPLAGRKEGSLKMEEFRQLPLLSRELIQESHEAMVTTALPSTHGRLFDVRTSGSTGRPISVKGTGITGTMYIAQASRGHIWHKRDLTLKNMTIRAMSAEKQFSRIKGWSAGSIGMGINADKKLPGSKLLEIIKEETPDYLQCYPSTLGELLRLSQKDNYVPPKLREVRTLSEVLDPELVVLTKKQWSIDVIDNYSSMELNIIAHQCPDDPNNMHLMAESILLEILDEDGNPCKVGEAGRCVATSLINYGSPLIRYEYGDYAVAGTACQCGRGLPTITKVIGRKHNLMVLPDGGKFAPTLPPADALFELPIRQYQLVQTKPDEIEIRVVTNRPLNKAEELRLIKIYAEDEGYPFNFVVCYMEEIPNLANGKYDFFRCEIDQ